MLQKKSRKYWSVGSLKFSGSQSLRICLLPILVRTISICIGDFVVFAVHSICLAVICRSQFFIMNISSSKVIAIVLHLFLAFHVLSWHFPDFGMKKKIIQESIAVFMSSYRIRLIHVCYYTFAWHKIFSQFWLKKNVA